MKQEHATFQKAAFMKVGVVVVACWSFSPLLYDVSFSISRQMECDNA